jgi:hypothetical protein
MLIQIDLSSLREVKWHEYLTRFVLGGLITLVTGIIAKCYGPVTGGLFLALPVIFPASATLLEKHERDKKRRAGIAFTLRGRLAAALDACGAAMGAIAMLGFAAFVWRALPIGHTGVILGIAAVLWLFLATFLWYVRKRHPWSPPRTPHR